jgi:hypothetical protein
VAYNGAVYAGTLLNINVAAAGALTVLNPLLAQIDFTLFGSLGIGSLQADLQAQLSAALKAQLDIGIGIVNPYAGFAIALAGIAVLQAQITLALSGGVPSISLEVTGQLSALAAFSGVLAAQIGGLEALVQGAIAVKTPATSFAGALSGALQAGPLFVLTFEDIAMAQAGSSLAGDFATGLNLNGNNIQPSDHVYGIVIVTKSVSAWAGVQATMLTA